MQRRNERQKRDRREEWRASQELKWGCTLYGRESDLPGQRRAFDPEWLENQSEAEGR